MLSTVTLDSEAFARSWVSIVRSPKSLRAVGERSRRSKTMGRGASSPAFLSSRSLRVSITVEVVFPVPRFPRSAHRLECSPSNPRAHETRRSTASEVYASLLMRECESNAFRSSNVPTTACASTNWIAGLNVKRFDRFDSASATSSEITDPFAELRSLISATTLSRISFTSFLTSSSLALLFLTSLLVSSESS